jgi:hypothetical protein
MESIQPRKIQSKEESPNRRPTRIPLSITPNIFTRADMTAVPPNCAHFRRLNSRPIQNIRTMTPISLQRSIEAVSATLKNRGK